MHVASSALLHPCHGDLIDDLLSLPRIVARRTYSAGEISRPHVASFRVLRDPPLQQNRVAHVLARDRPVKLRSEVVHPAFVQPLLRIRVQLGVCVESFYLRRIAGSPDAERADSKLYPGFCRLDLFIEISDT